ncbi:MAG: hypothetical protein AAGA60_31430 [Cyanobacteria bacterium P01_E01_bin.42]
MIFPEIAPIMPPSKNKKKTPTEAFSEALKKANAKLDRVKIEKHHNRLRLVGTLPRKDRQPGTKRERISTGYPTNQNGINLALARAKDLESDIYLERFSWVKWGNEHAEETCRDAIAKMHRDWEKEQPRTREQCSNFQRDYLWPCEFLRTDLKLTEHYLRQVIERESEPKTRLRKRFEIAFQRLAKAGGLDCDLSGMAYGYKPQKRVIPSEAEVITAREQIENDEWRWVFSMIAAYGLRPHEVFRLDCSRLGDPPYLLSVLEKTKTRARPVLPLSGKDDPCHE